jgi:hypothetical protein
MRLMRPRELGWKIWNDDRWLKEKKWFDLMMGIFTFYDGVNYVYENGNLCASNEGSIRCLLFFPLEQL